MYKQKWSKSNSSLSLDLKEDLEPLEKNKFKDIDEFENEKKNDTKHEKDDESVDDEASGDHESADEASEKKDDYRRKFRVNKRFLPLLRIPLYLNKPFYPWMKHSYCFHPVCHGEL